MPTSPAHLRTRIGRAFVSRVLWIALVLAVCNAVLPTALRAVSAVRGDQVVTICTSFGAKKVQMDSSGQAARDAQQGDTCQYCLASQLACLPPVALAMPTPTALPAATVATSAGATPFLSAAWRSDQPRAPPRLS